MNSIKLLDPQQLLAIRFIVSRPSSFIVADMGVGKTLITLAAIKYMISAGAVKKALILAPLNVTTLVWPDEIESWHELSDLDYVVVRGNAKQRLKKLKEDHQIYLMNYENFSWLRVALCTFSGGNFTKKILPSKLQFPFDMVVFDESVKMASISNDRFKAWKPFFDRFKYRVNLTADPIPNTYKTLYGQTYLLDSGDRFGHNYSHFLSEYFHLVGRSGFNWQLKRGAGSEIIAKVADLTFRIRGEPREYDTVDLTAKLGVVSAKQYVELETKMFVELDEKRKEKVVFPSKLVSMGKCCQYVGGNIYIGTGKFDKKGKELSEPVYGVHDYKMRLLDKCVKELGKRRALIVYDYSHERDVILNKYPQFVCFTAKDNVSQMAAWNRGEIQFLMVHPKSSSHGLNLQSGGYSVIFYTIPWSRDYYNQTIGRLNRRGQKKKVKVYRLLIENTIDMVKVESLRTRTKGSDNLLRILEKYRKGTR